MNRNLSLLSALGTALILGPQAFSQTAAAPAPTPPATATASAAPQAVNAKIALINFEQVVLASNEGQVMTAAIQKKFEPKQTQLEALAGEVDTLKKNLQSAPATLPDEERASRLRAIDTKEKQLNRDAEDARTAYTAESQESLNKVAIKVNTMMQTYAQQNGYTLVLDISNPQQTGVMFALPSTNISQAIVEAYNKQSGIAAPPPSAPRAGRPAGSPSRPTTTAPRPSAKPPVK